MSDTAIECGPIGREEVAEAARVYVASFPRRVGRLFRREAPALRFYQDLFELMRLAYPDSFLAARAGGRFVGFLVLTMPGRGLGGALLREGFALRAATHALTGQYGLPLAATGRVLDTLTSRRVAAPADLEALPHVYVVTADPAYTGRGVGSALLAGARRACEAADEPGRAYEGMWLLVDADNAGAIRLYQRTGFRDAGLLGGQRVMVWRFGAPEG